MAGLADTGGTGGTFLMECGTNTLSGTIAKTQTVTLQGNGCGDESATLAGTSVTNDGTVSVTDGATLGLYGGSAFTQGTGATLGVTVDAPAGSAYGLFGSGSGTVAVGGTLDVTTVGTPQHRQFLRPDLSNQPDRPVRHDQLRRQLRTRLHIHQPHLDRGLTTRNGFGHGRDLVAKQPWQYSTGS